MAIPVKLTRANQVTLPKRLLERAGWLNQEFFLADLEGDHLVLKPLTQAGHSPLASFEDLRRHFAQIGVRRSDVHDAVAWAREKNPRRKRRAR